MSKIWAAAVVVLALELGCATTGASGTTGTPSTSASESPEATITETDLSSSGSSAATQEKDQDEELVCFSEEVVGSHIPRKICQTKRKSKQQKDDAAKAFQTHQPTSPFHR